MTFKIIPILFAAISSSGEKLYFNDADGHQLLVDSDNLNDEDER